MNRSHLFVSMLVAWGGLSLPAQASWMDQDNWNENRQIYLTRAKAIATDADIAIRFPRQRKWRKALIRARLAKLERSYQEQTTLYGVSLLPALTPASLA